MILFIFILKKNEEKQMALYYDYVKILLASKGSFPTSVGARRQHHYVDHSITS
jgi:hypothetical protein